MLEGHNSATGVFLYTAVYTPSAVRGMPEKDWTFNPVWGTVIDYSGCQFGLETDGRCDYLACQFRTARDEAPGEVHTVMAMLCPREKMLEHKESTVHLSPDPTVA